MADTLESDVDLDAGEAPSKSKLPMLMMLIGLAGLGGGAYLAFGGAGSDPAETEGEAGPPAGAPSSGPLVDLDAFVVNLNERAEMRYLKCRIAIEAADEAAAASFEAETVRVRNAVLLYLSNLTLADIAGIEKKRAIQTALGERIRGVVGDDAVRQVYLTEFVVQ